MTSDEGMEQARAARERAEKALEEVRAQRPEVKDVAKRATRLHMENNFTRLTRLAFVPREVP